MIDSEASMEDGEIGRWASMVYRAIRWSGPAVLLDLGRARTEVEASSIAGVNVAASACSTEGKRDWKARIEVARVCALLDLAVLIRRVRMRSRIDPGRGWCV